MDQEYLPGDVRDRISDLSKEYGIGQNEIARRIGMSEGTFSRFMSGFTDKLSYRECDDHCYGGTSWSCT